MVDEKTKYLAAIKNEKNLNLSFIGSLNDIIKFHISSEFAWDTISKFPSTQWKPLYYIIEGIDDRNSIIIYHLNHEKFVDPYGFYFDDINKLFFNLKVTCYQAVEASHSSQESITVKPVPLAELYTAIISAASKLPFATLFQRATNNIGAADAVTIFSQIKTVFPLFMLAHENNVKMIVFKKITSPNVSHNVVIRFNDNVEKVFKAEDLFCNPEMILNDSKVKTIQERLKGQINFSSLGASRHLSEFDDLPPPTKKETEEVVKNLKFSNRTPSELKYLGKWIDWLHTYGEALHDMLETNIPERFSCSDEQVILKQCFSFYLKTAANHIFVKKFEKIRQNKTHCKKVYFDEERKIYGSKSEPKYPVNTIHVKPDPNECNDYYDNCYK